MYKTIVVHVDGGPSQASRLQAAALLANAHDAHLIGAAPTGVSWLDLSLLSGSMALPLPLDALRGLRDAVTQHADDPYVDPERWQAQVHKHSGSWWPAWEAWLARLAGPDVAPPAPVSDLRPAPGSYVLQP